MPKTKSASKLFTDEEERHYDEVAEKSRFHLQEYWNLQLRLAPYRDLVNVMDTAQRKGYEKGLKEGFQEGFEESFKEGFDKGLKEGEQQIAVELARQLLQENLSLSRIAEITGLSKKEIKALQK